MKRKYPPIIFSLILLLTGQLWGQRSVELPRGTAIQVRLSEEISSEKARTGDRFDAILDQDISDRDYLLARRGDPVVGTLVRVNNGDRDEGDLIELTLTELRSGNRTYTLDTNNIIVRTKDADDGDNDAAIVGGGAGAGAIIGAIAGGLKGAIIGAAVGAGAGAATILITDQDRVEFEPEQKFRFYLDRGVQMTAAGNADSQQTGSRDDDRYSRDDDRYGQHQDSGYGSYVREDVRDQVSELDRNAEHVWSMIQNDSGMNDTIRRSSSRESEDAMRLYIAISNFANSTEQVQRFVQDSRTAGLRGATESLVRQAENIDQLLRSVNTFGHFQGDWRQVQSSLSRLANNFNLAYTPGGTTYRAE